MLITFDLETFKFEPGLAAPRPVVAGVKVDDGPTQLYPLWDSRAVTKFQALLHHPDALYLGHNLPYDWSVLAAWGYLPIRRVFDLYRANRVRDTQVREKLIDIAQGRRKGMVLDIITKQWRKVSYKLASLETYYTGKDRSADKTEDAWRERYGELFGLPLEYWPEKAKSYVVDDVDATYAVYQAQRARVDLPHNMNQDPQDPTRCVDEHRQVFKAWGLRLISCWGVRTDPTRVVDLDAEVSSKVDALQAKMLEEGLYKWGGTKKAPKLTKNMAAIKARTIKAYDALGEPAPLTDKGNIKTDADSLKHSGDELLDELGGGGPLNTVKNTFLPVLKRGLEVPINTSYDELKNTGRTSSYEPNLANIPRSLGVRECFLARSGTAYISVDWAAAELRALAQLLEWRGWASNFAQTFRDDPKADPHKGLAKQLVGADGDFKKARQDAKAANFGYPGGMREKKFVAQARKQGMIFTLERATELRNAWLRSEPAMEYYLAWGSRVSRAARDRGGYTTMIQPNPWGGLHRVRGGLDYSDLLNTGFQGLVADAFCDALCEASYQAYCDGDSALYGTRPVFGLYDELILECPLNNLHAAGERLTLVMNNALNKWCPDVPSYCEPAAMYRWSKGAELKLDNDDKLTTWDEL